MPGKTVFFHGTTGKSWSKLPTTSGARLLRLGGGRDEVTCASGGAGALKPSEMLSVDADAPGSAAAPFAGSAA